MDFADAPVFLRLVCPLGGLLYLGATLAVNPAGFWRIAADLQRGLQNFLREINPGALSQAQDFTASPTALQITRLFGLVICISTLMLFIVAAQA